MKPGKSPGSDGIPAGMVGEVVVSRLQDLLISCWEQGILPQDLKHAVIIPLYKNKGEKSDCSNYRGITLLSIAGKVLARILLNRLIPSIIEDFTPESQCGFRANRGTTDMIFVLRQIQEKCKEQNMGLFVAFIDLTKAFDMASRDGLWKILSRLGCPPKFLTIICQLHEERSGEAQQLPIRQFPDLQRHQARLCACTLTVLHLLQHDATPSKGASKGGHPRWNLHPLPLRWQPVQS